MLWKHYSTVQSPNQIKRPETVNVWLLIISLLVIKDKVLLHKTACKMHHILISYRHSSSVIITFLARLSLLFLGKVEAVLLGGRLCSRVDLWAAASRRASFIGLVGQVQVLLGQLQVPPQPLQLPGRRPLVPEALPPGVAHWRVPQLSFQFLLLHGGVVSRWSRRHGTWGGWTGGAWAEGGPRAEGGPPAEGVPDAADTQMDHFKDGEEQAEERHNVHRQQEDGLLRGAGHKAVHSVRARRAGAHVRGYHLKSVEDVLAEKEGDLEGRAPQQLAHVDFHQAVTLDPPTTIMLFLCALKIERCWLGSN